MKVMLNAVACLLVTVSACSCEQAYDLHRENSSYGSETPQGGDRPGLSLSHSPAGTTQISGSGESVPEDHIELDEYGGLKIVKLDSTGYFRLENLDGRWILVTPHGYPFYIIAINGVTPWYQDYRLAGYREAYHENFTLWAKTASSRIDSLGFNTVAHKTARQFIQHMRRGRVREIPFTVLIPFVQENEYPDVFSDGFQDLADRKAGEYCSRLSNEPYLIGYFIGNELDFSLYRNGALDWRSRWVQALLKQDAATPARQQLTELLKKEFGSIEELRSKIDTTKLNIDSFEEIGFQQLWPALRKRNPQAVRVMKSFNALVAEQFYRVTEEAIRKYDSHHLILGSRFANDADVEVLRTTRDYTDVVSINIYPQAGRFPGALYAKVYENSLKPVFHTELSYLEAGRNGSYPPVANQKQRGVYYEKLVLSIVEVDEVIGFGWHQMFDPKSESNFGLYDIHDALYSDAAKRVKAANRKVSQRFSEIVLEKIHARRNNEGDRTGMHLPVVPEERE